MKAEIKFKPEQMSRLVESDNFLLFLKAGYTRGDHGNMPERRWLEMVFNTYVAGDSVMEREYAKHAGRVQ